MPGGTSSVPCTAPLTGRYVTLQKIVKPDIPDKRPINWGEVIIESSPVSSTGGEKIEILLREPTSDSPASGQCPSNYPYAFNFGAECCSVGFEDNTDPLWIEKWSFGLLNYGSDTCGGKSIDCGSPPCLNYKFQVDYIDKLGLSFGKLCYRYCSVELV